MYGVYIVFRNFVANKMMSKIYKFARFRAVGLGEHGQGTTIVNTEGDFSGWHDGTIRENSLHGAEMMLVVCDGNILRLFCRKGD